MDWFGTCPCCRERIKLTKSSRRFICPDCSCEFRHNSRRWFIGVPLALAAFIFIFVAVISLRPALPLGLIVFAPLAAAVIMYFFPYYVAVSTTDKTEKV